MKANRILLFNFVIIIFFSVRAYAETSSNKDVEAISVNLKMFIDLANLEYDDTPYAGRTNIGNVLIPYFLIQAKPLDIELGGWYKYIYVQFDEDQSPEPRICPFCKSGLLAFLILIPRGRSPP